MKKLLYTIIGVLLVFPVFIADTFGISLSNFRQEVFKPENIVAREGDAEAVTKINEVAEYIIDLILFASGGIAVFMIVLGGIMYIVSFGNDDKMIRAKDILKYAGIGLGAVIFAFLIVSNVIDLIFSATT